MSMPLVAGFITPDPEWEKRFGKNMPVERLAEMGQRRVFFRELNVETGAAGETWVEITVVNGRWFVEWGEPAA